MASTVTRKRAVEVIHHAYPGAGNIRIVQYLHPRYGWMACNYHLREAARLHDTGIKAVQVRLIDRYGQERRPDYHLEEWVERFEWRPGDTLQVWVNQGMRSATVLAISGDEALVEYEMPRGSTVLWVIDRWSPEPCFIRSVSHRSCPLKWRKAIVESGQEWVGVPQGRNSRTVELAGA